MRANSLTEQEYVYLLSSVNAIYESKYNCFHCTTSREGKALETVQRIKGCQGLPAFVHRIENVRYSTCPGNLTWPGANYFTDIWQNFTERGIFPEGGTYSDNSYKWWEIFAVIKMIHTTHVKKAESAAKMKARKKR